MTAEEDSVAEFEFSVSEMEEINSSCDKRRKGDEIDQENDGYDDSAFDVKGAYG